MREAGRTLRPTGWVVSHGSPGFWRLGCLSSSEASQTCTAAPQAPDSFEMGKPDRLGWLAFGCSIVVVVGCAVTARWSPAPYLTYCTAEFGTCIPGGGRGPRLVLDRPPGPIGQSLRFTFGYRCHSIPVSGFSTPLKVCPATCGK